MVNFMFGVMASLLCIPAQFQMNKNRFARYYQSSSPRDSFLRNSAHMQSKISIDLPHSGDSASMLEASLQPATP
eukprot:CAMPEP_0170457844 /NCGR_PEP_ID=MMETSP0123-20130129/4994_1 /TAXON_ID=182087 /ORGANISM="Favella ehrenbergii, Strain Fehren 1" /LENGTH=73 /DNA_ID=CAMNT_0010721759 /DNA_START=453 /DNA_END=674 /DNA_ORIENTATION=-